MRVMHLGSVLEGEAMPFTKHKIKVTVSTKVACVTMQSSHVNWTPISVTDSHKQPGTHVWSTSFSMLVMSTHDMHHFHHVVSSSVPHKQVEWCMMYSTDQRKG